MNTIHLPDSLPDKPLESTYLKVAQAVNVVVQRASVIVSQAIKMRGHDRPPFLPEEFAVLFGIRRIVKADLGQAGAILLRSPDGYIIKINEKHSIFRQNFSCAHEIGHTILDELKINIKMEELEFRTFNPQGEKKNYIKAKERLCDIAATELLMPQGIFKKYLSEFGVCINTIERLANIFRVSIQATAIRVAELSTEPCVMLQWNKRKNSKVLYFAWSVGPGRERGMNFYVPKYKQQSFTSTLHDAYYYDRSTSCRRLFGSNEKDVYMESKGFGRGETRSVISLAFPNR